MSGAPVVDDRKEFIGFISEFDALRALEAGKDRSTLTTEDVMVHEPMAVTSESTIEDAMKMMEEKRLLNFPVKQNGRMAYSVTRPPASLDRLGHDGRSSTRDALAPG